MVEFGVWCEVVLGLNRSERPCSPSDDAGAESCVDAEPLGPVVELRIDHFKSSFKSGMMSCGCGDDCGNEVR